MGIFKSKKQREAERLEAERIAVEKAKNEAFEKELKEKTLINRTLKTLKNQIDRYEEQQKKFITLARMAEKRGNKKSYAFAASALKMVRSQCDRVSEMYLALTVSNEMRSVAKDSRAFVDSMSVVSRQLAEINSSIDFGSVGLEFEKAMQSMSMAEEKLKEFSDNIQESVSEYADSGFDEKMDAAIDALIHDTATEERTEKNYTTDRTTVDINSRIKEMEEMLHGC